MSCDYSLGCFLVDNHSCFSFNVSFFYPSTLDTVFGIIFYYCSIILVILQYLNAADGFGAISLRRHPGYIAQRLQMMHFARAWSMISISDLRASRLDNPWYFDPTHGLYTSTRTDTKSTVGNRHTGMFTFSTKRQWTPDGSIDSEDIANREKKVRSSVDPNHWFALAVSLYDSNFFVSLLTLGF